ncbi:hypothetical protein QTP86_022078 [Hemibagrus guttatus]|nr:hypothetical protein QTP86_022078 [Hemibagrus guttatus]
MMISKSISKSITTRSKQKSWMTAKVHVLLKSRDSAFRAGDKDALRTARAKPSQAIREAKHTHSQRIPGHFQSSSDTRRMWQGIQSITKYRPAPPACDSDASLLDALNNFYAWFEAWNDVMARKTIPPPEDQVLCLTVADVRQTLCKVNPRKAAGPDNIPGRVLRECAEQIADVFTDIFNISLSSAIVLTCLKTTTIILVPKKSPVSCLNDYHPIALTRIMMKCFERLKRDDRQEHQILRCSPGRGPHLVVQHQLHHQESPAASPLSAKSEEGSSSTSYPDHLLQRDHPESILSSCITAWFGNCTVSDRKTLQRIVKTAKKIIGVSLPSIMDIYSTRCICKANSIVNDPTHPSHTLFTLLPSGKRRSDHSSMDPSRLHPCAFFSHKLNPVERNYDIGNRELLAIKLALEEWRHWLEGARHPFLVL